MCCSYSVRIEPPPGRQTRRRTATGWRTGNRNRQALRPPIAARHEHGLRATKKRRCGALCAYSFGSPNPAADCAAAMRGCARRWVGVKRAARPSAIWNRGWLAPTSRNLPELPMVPLAVSAPKVGETPSPFPNFVAVRPAGTRCGKRLISRLTAKLRAANHWNNILSRRGVCEKSRIPVRLPRWSRGNVGAVLRARRFAPVSGSPTNGGWDLDHPSQHAGGVSFPETTPGHVFARARAFFAVSTGNQVETTVATRWQPARYHRALVIWST